MSITKQVGVVSLGTAVGQGLIVLVTPLLARMYTPQDFGQLALLLTVASYAAAGACLRYDLALATSSDDEAPRLFWLCLLSTCGAVCIAWLAASLPWARWVEAAPVIAVLQEPLMLCATVAAVGTYQAVSNNLVRAGQFRRLAWLRAAQGIVFSGTALLSLIGLVIALPLSYLGSAILAWRRVSLVRVRAIVDAAVRHRSYPLLSLPGAVFDALACSAVILIISTRYGISEVGNFSQIQRLVGAPFLLISASLFQVFLRMSAERYLSGESLIPLLAKVFGRVALLVAVLMACVLLFGEPVLRVVLGPEWRVDRYFLAVIVGALAVRIAVSPFSSILFTTGRLRTLMGWQFAYFVSSFAVLGFAAARLGFDAFLAVFAVHELVLYAAYLGLIVRAARVGKAA